METANPITPLDVGGDRAVVAGWLSAYLKQHLAWWSEAYGLGWDGATIATRIAEGGLVERDWRGLVEATKEPRKWVGVCRDGHGQPAGLVWVGASPERFVGELVGHIDWIYVCPESRGSGLASHLIRAGLEWMREQGCVGAEVFVTGANRRATGLYWRAGFQSVDERMLMPLG